eukprot:g1886.t1
MAFLSLSPHSSSAREAQALATHPKGHHLKGKRLFDALKPHAFRHHRDAGRHTSLSGEHADADASFMIEVCSRERTGTMSSGAARAAKDVWAAARHAMHEGHINRAHFTNIMHDAIAATENAGLAESLRSHFHRQTSLRISRRRFEWIVRIVRAPQDILQAAAAAAIVLLLLYIPWQISFWQLAEQAQPSYMPALRVIELVCDVLCLVECAQHALLRRWERIVRESAYSSMERSLRNLRWAESDSGGGLGGSSERAGSGAAAGSAGSNGTDSARQAASTSVEQRGAHGVQVAMQSHNRDSLSFDASLLAGAQSKSAGAASKSQDTAKAGELLEGYTRSDDTKLGTTGGGRGLRRWRWRRGLLWAARALLFVAAALPYQYVMLCGRTADAQRYLGLLLLLKLLRAKRLLRYRAVVDLVAHSVNLDRAFLFAVALFLLVFSHYVGCGTYFFGINHVEAGSLATRFTAQQAYVDSLYWAVVTTISTAPPEDYVPDGAADSLVVVLVVLIGALFGAAIFGAVFREVERQCAAQDRYISARAQLSEFQHLYGVDELTLRRMRRHIDLQWHESRHFKMDALLGDMPINLRRDIKAHLLSSFVGRVLRLAPAGTDGGGAGGEARGPSHDRDSRNLMSMLCLKLEQELMSPDEYVFYEGEIGYKMYCLRHGIVLVLSAKRRLAVDSDSAVAVPDSQQLLRNAGMSHVPLITKAMVNQLDFSVIFAYGCFVRLGSAQLARLANEMGIWLPADYMGHGGHAVAGSAAVEGEATGGLRTGQRVEAGRARSLTHDNPMARPDAPAALETVERVAEARRRDHIITRILLSQKRLSASVAKRHGARAFRPISSDVICRSWRAHDQHVRTLYDGSCFGEIALVERTKRSASIMTHTWCELYSLDRSSFEEVMANYPAFWKSVAENIRRTKSK